MSEQTARVLDRLPEFDERSRAFPARMSLAPRQLSKGPRNNVRWSLGPRLDQGSEGACVGFGWANELAATPRVVASITNDIARSIYYGAQNRDEWEGNAYQGTSVIAGAKEVQARGLISGYRWCFSIEELALAISWSGPVVLGLNWHEGMVSTDASGFIHPTGSVVGGHAILCYARITLPNSLVTYRLVNSWGPNWGVDGTCAVYENELAQLLADNGEACVPIGRKKTPVRAGVVGLWDRAVNLVAA